ncbi:hypothetical protein ACLESD_16265 [Pyxidicoccus sp. 3LFB2]
MGSDPFPPSRFFVLKSQRNTRHDTEFFTVNDEERADAPKCPRCGGVVGMLTWRPPFRVKLVLHGEEPGDFIQFLGASSDIIISERFADAFRAAGLTGLHGFDPVEVVKVQRKRRGARAGFTLPQYRAVTVTFGSALVDEARSHILRPGPFDCDYCRAIGTDGVNGFSLEPGSWNGDDFFLPRGLVGTFVVSERFAQFVAEHQITNTVLTPTEQYVWDPLRRFSQPAQG